MKQITAIKFENYKSFKEFSITLKDFNILVGPNNAGKSTIIGSLKILMEGIKKARHKKAVMIDDPKGMKVYGYEIDLTQVPIATENVFHNYDDSEPAIIKFILSDKSFLQIFFPVKGVCYMNYESSQYVIKSPKEFKEHINIEIGYVPILGPVDHRERLYQKEAARLAILSYTASRNFRNIWHHYGEDFEEFRDLVKSTWPGMDINKPEINNSENTPTLDMFCPEERIPREIFWAGFGFQVWCQMLTYIIKNKEANLFIIDEPDIYLHSELQRQLLGILKGLGPSIIIATHSTEIISEAEPNDIVVINKSNQSAKRLKDPTQLRQIFTVLGSNLNPTLTQIAKSRRVLFVEGKDFSFISKIARKIKLDHVANRTDFAVVPIEGFNPTRLRAFKEGIEKTIGASILSAVIFDKDYRSKNQVSEELSDLKKGNHFAVIHSAKEIENFMLIPAAIKKAIIYKIDELNSKKSKRIIFDKTVEELLLEASEPFKLKTLSQIQAHQLRYEKKSNTKLDEATIIESIMTEFDKNWQSLETRLKLLPGKEFLSALNQMLQSRYSVSISHLNIINNISKELIPQELKDLLVTISDFRKHSILK